MASQSKVELRRLFRQVRREAMVSAQAGVEAAALNNLPALAREGAWLGLYWPIGAEPDLRAIAQTVNCALPVVEGEQLLYRPWQRNQPLEPDECGIPAPTAGNGLEPAELAALLVPALALDGLGIRLGSGGGWYDRLRGEPQWRAVPALAVLPSACLCPALPRDPWDVPFDGWLDERGLHWI